MSDAINASVRGGPMTPRGLTIARLREVLSYDPQTGIFLWQVPRRGRQVGTRAGMIDPHGYRRITIDQKSYAAGCLAWAHIHGVFPDRLVDHRSRGRAEDRLSNLRLATRAQNAQNGSRHRDNASGFKGVHLHKQTGRWRAQIYVATKRIHLGLYDTPEAAHAAYVAAASTHFGPFSTDGGDHR